ncbi:MAG: hypothetical protein N3F67_04075 [Acidilobaceae archaeon]|nr:hypothetical protein [Acidilobaceae archaeon]
MKRVLAYNIIYGGLLLSYVCGPIVPISRAHLDIEIELFEGGERREVSDAQILKAWALIYSGSEAEGLGLLQGRSYFPVELGWKPGKGARVPPVGIEVSLSAARPRSSSP